MGLVNGKEANAKLPQQAQGTLLQQPLWGAVEDAELAGAQIFVDRLLLGRAGTRMQGGCSNPAFAQGLDLILHERDEGGNDHCRAR